MFFRLPFSPTHVLLAADSPRVGSRADGDGTPELLDLAACGPTVKSRIDFGQEEATPHQEEEEAKVCIVVVAFRCCRCAVGVSAAKICRRGDVLGLSVVFRSGQVAGNLFSSLRVVPVWYLVAGERQSDAFTALDLRRFCFPRPACVPPKTWRCGFFFWCSSTLSFIRFPPIRPSSCFLSSLRSPNIILARNAELIFLQREYMPILLAHLEHGKYNFSVARARSNHRGSHIQYCVAGGRLN